MVSKVNDILYVRISLPLQMVRAPAAARGKIGETSKKGMSDSEIEQQLAALKDM